MNNSKNLLAAIVIVVVIAAGAFLVASMMKSNETPASNETTQEPNQATTITFDSGSIFNVSFDYSSELGSTILSSETQTLADGSLYCLSETIAFEKAALEVSIVFGAPECSGAIGGDTEPIDGQYIDFDLLTIVGGGQPIFGMGARSNSFPESSSPEILSTLENLNGKFFVSINTNQDNMNLSESGKYKSYITEIAQTINVDTASIKTLQTDEVK